MVAPQLREAPADGLQRERVVAEQLLRLVQECLCALEALAVVTLRLGLPEPGDAVVGELDPEHLLLDGGLAGDREGSARRSVARRWVSLTPGTLSPSAPVAQGIERAPPEREVAGSIPARRTSFAPEPVSK